MNILFPKIRPSRLPAMLAYAGVGAVLAGLYGAIHDEITYSISSEYFTKVKFYQFEYADFGWPPRVFAAEVGFLATWWVGFFAAWFLARVAVPAFPPRAAFLHIVRGFAIVFACGLVAGAVGYGYGVLTDVNRIGAAWKDVAESLGINDATAFARVAYIHNASYLGGLVGLVFAILHLRRRRLH